MDKSKKFTATPYTTSTLNCTMEFLGESSCAKENAAPNDREIVNKLTSIENRLAIIEEKLCKHTVLLEQLTKKFSPQSLNMELFPINTIKELYEIDNTVQMKPEEEIILYLKEFIGRADLWQVFPKMFGEQLILKINWNGAKKKTAIKDIKLFSTHLFEAVKNVDLGYPEYEEQMKNGFRRAKSQFYRNTYQLKKKK